MHLVPQSCLTLCSPMDCSLPSNSVHGDSPGKNTRVGCHAVLQGIFLIQRSNPGFPHCGQILYLLGHCTIARKKKTLLSNLMEDRCSEKCTPNRTILFISETCFQDKCDAIFFLLLGTAAPPANTWNHRGRR